ncbi:MAG TPA: HDOD domain-containing protein [Gallionella sp.]|nr:HDOD domain-containing protein [Gallionella sp.]
MTTQQKDIASRVLAALESGQTELPTLPDIALKLRDLLQDSDVAVNRIVSLLSTDPVISMHVIRAANSAALFRGEPVFNLHDAVLKLGNQMLHSMIMNITLNKLFQARSPLIDRTLKQLWEHSHAVAANSYVLAREQAHLRPDTAMLIGLVHGIGALPLYLYADRHYPQIESATLDSLVGEHAAAITPRLLKNWSFPEELVEVVASQSAQKELDGADRASYSDVLAIAVLQADDPEATLSRRDMLAAERLGYYAADCRNFQPNHREQLASVKNLLRVDVARSGKLQK